MTRPAVDVVRDYCRLMASDDFHSVGTVLVHRIVGNDTEAVSDVGEAAANRRHLVEPIA